MQSGTPLIDQPRGAHWKQRFSSTLVSVSDVACRPHELGCTHDFCFSQDRLCFVRRGVFRKHRAREPVLVDSGIVAYFAAGEEFRTSHLGMEGDDCTFLDFDRGLIEEAAAGAPLHTTSASPATVLASRVLFAAISRGGSGLEIEERALALLQGVRAESGPSPANPVSARACKLAQAAREILAGDPTHPHTLAALSKMLACSPYHLARTFRAVSGVTPHRFLTQLRLSVALDRILAGENDLSALAHDVGFSSHSHFSHAFRRAFGTSPSSARTALANAPLQKH
jgi:AraC-like DNA-binding protein